MTRKILLLTLLLSMTTAPLLGMDDAQGNGLLSRLKNYSRDCLSDVREGLYNFNRQVEASEKSDCEEIIISVDHSSFFLSLGEFLATSYWQVHYVFGGGSAYDDNAPRLILLSNADKDSLNIHDLME